MADSVTNLEVSLALLTNCSWQHFECVCACVCVLVHFREKFRDSFWPLSEHTVICGIFFFAPLMLSRSFLFHLLNFAASEV